MVVDAWLETLAPLTNRCVSLMPVWAWQVYHWSMHGVPDLAQTRFDNALALFDEFVRNTVKHPDASTLRGLERRFAERLLIQPSYWSQIKSRSRQIGERLARQFEQLCHKPHGWMDQPHGELAVPAGLAPDQEETASNYTPQDDDERFILGLVMSYYRRHPQRAKTRLLDLLGEVLVAGPAQLAGATAARTTAPQKQVVATDDAHALWLRSQQGVAPLRQKK